MTIQRWNGSGIGVWKSDRGAYVEYEDHLAAMRRADEDYKNVEAVANLAISLANEFEIAVA